MKWKGTPTTLFRAMKCANGKVVCVESDVIAQTTKVVWDSDEYYKAVGQGWCDSPQEAMDQFEQAEQDIGQAAAERAGAELTMSRRAQQEAADYEKKVSTHVPVIPEATRRGRRKKT